MLFSSNSILVGTLVGNGTLTVINGGTATAQEGVFVRALGTLRGNGQIVGNFDNIGVVAPGTTPGALHVTGNVSQGASGKLEIDLGGIIPDTQHDQLVVSGDVALDGTLEVSLIDGFEPTFGCHSTL
jgi:hypothetical protein